MYKNSILKKYYLLKLINLNNYKRKNLILFNRFLDVYQIPTIQHVSS